jgi:UDP-N-acetylmuramoyl-L-alanyl-D-glutamate--2,6-diaminopimelate ligase
MMQIKDILYGVELLSVKGSTANNIEGLTFDSRDCAANDLFFAVRGTKHDGHGFIGQVIEKGCKAIICEEEQVVPDDVTLIIVPDSSKALAICSNNFFGEPSKQLKLIGVTGTNGKTTIATLLYNLYQELGYQTGLLSTVVNKIDGEDIPSTHTTPDPISLNRLLARMVDEGVSHCFMEVSSHAIHQHRTTGLNFVGGIFTNITHDHLDYHKTFKEYLNVKKSFFDHLGDKAFAITNADDKNGSVMLQNTSAKKRSYAVKNVADYKAKVLENQFTGLVLSIEGTELWSKLIGDFNASNLLAVYATARELGEDHTEILTALSKIEAVTGRFQYFRSPKGVTAIVDYAHTPDALENVLKTISNIRTKNETVFTVVGCGGDRDKAKRPLMADIACKYSDKVILTSDNPRSEDPDQIIADMMEGVGPTDFKKTLSITDRAQAIKTALSMAEKEDIILIAGKGHETYQEIKGVKYDFDDMAIVTEMLNKLEK